MVNGAPSNAGELLSADDLHGLSSLVLSTRGRARSGYIGRHRASGPGQSTEFHDFRSYVAGDEPRRVDWKLYGRTDRLYVRQYRHDAALRVHLIVDRSASMDYADGEGAGKWDYARRLAAALAWLATRQQDRVRLTLIGQGAEAAAPEGGSADHLRRVLTALASASCGGVSAPEAALRAAAKAGPGGRRPSDAGLTVVISDLLDRTRPWLRGLAALSSTGGDVLVLQVLTRSEWRPDRLRAGRLVDPEGGGSVRADPAADATGYERRIRRYVGRLRAGLATWGAAHALCRTDRPMAEALREVLAGRRRGGGRGG